MRMASGNLAGRWSSPPTGVDSTCPADTARYPASPAHPTSPTDEPPAGPRRVPRPLRQPDAPRAAGQVQALDARLDMVLAESPGDPSGLQIFAVWLLCGLLPWTFLANGLTGAMESLISNANLIRKVYFPREVLVAATTATSCRSCCRSGSTRPRSSIRPC